MVDEPFDFKATYRAEGWGAGIAWRATGYASENVEVEVEDFGDEVYYEYEVVEDTSRIVAHMVGDDSNFTFDREDLIPIDEDEYCPECGQIGCKAYG